MSPQLLVPLAHAGEGATWQALLTLLGIGIAVVVVLAVVGRVTLASPGDLILPLAAVAVLASLSGAASETLSDWVWWAFPVGVVLLVALVVAATTSLSLTPTSPLLLGAVVLAVVATVLFDDTITRAWHPAPIERTIQSYAVDDLDVTLTMPEEGATVEAGDVVVEVVVEGGTVLDGPAVTEQAEQATLADPEEGGYLQVLLDGTALFDPDGGPLSPDQDCADGCTTVTYTIPDVAPGDHRVIVEFRASDRNVFSPAVFRQAQFTAE